MPPFVKQLAASFRQLAVEFTSANLGSVKFIAAPCSFDLDFSQVSSQSGGWIGQFEKPMKLWMIFVAVCFPMQNFLCQQRLAPKRHESSRIEMFRMQRPEAHSIKAP